VLTAIPAHNNHVMTS